MKVSVVVSSYDTEQYLRKCLDSIVNQTLKDIEIIVINDGSPDNSVQIIKEYEKKDDRIVFFDIENKGVSNARNIGLQNAKGQYIIFIDSDDYLDLNMLEIMYNEISNSKSDMAVCNFLRVFDDYSEDKFLKLPIKKEIIAGNVECEFASKVMTEEYQFGGCVWNKLFSRDLILNANIVFEERSEIFAEDAFFLLKILKHIRKICIVDEPLYYYYQRKTSVSNSYKKEYINRCENFISGIERYYADNRLQEALSIRSYSFFVEILLNEMQSKNGYRTFREISLNKYFRGKLSNLNVSSFSTNKKIIYYLYKNKMIFLMYLAFKVFRGR